MSATLYGRQNPAAMSLVVSGVNLSARTVTLAAGRLSAMFTAAVMPTTPAPITQIDGPILCLLRADERRVYGRKYIWRVTSDSLFDWSYVYVLIPERYDIQKAQ